jgi:hypothetical protein
VAYHEQRRCFAGTTLQPQNFWGTRSGTESNLQYAIPTRDDDSLQFKIAARQNQTIRHWCPCRTCSCLQRRVARAGGRQRSHHAHSTFSVKPQSYVGASKVQPLIVNTTVLFGSARGGHVREMGYSNEGGGWITGDLSLRDPIRFDGYDITDAALSKPLSGRLVRQHRRQPAQPHLRARAEHRGLGQPRHGRRLRKHLLRRRGPRTCCTPSCGAPSAA